MQGNSPGMSFPGGGDSWGANLRAPFQWYWYSENAINATCLIKDSVTVSD